jgi:hypothetical protein
MKGPQYFIYIKKKKKKKRKKILKRRKSKRIFYDVLGVLSLPSPR